MARTSNFADEAELLARGNLTLPKALRDQYKLKPGMRFTVIDMGDGALMLVPRRLRVDRLAEPLAEALAASGDSLESMLTQLDALRERPSTYAADDTEAA